MRVLGSELMYNETTALPNAVCAKITISLDNRVFEQLLTYTQAKTVQEGVVKAITEYIRYQQRQELLSCRGAIDIEDNWQALRNLECQA